MKRFFLVILTCLVHLAFAQDVVIRLDFTPTTPYKDGIWVTGPGMALAPIADVTFATLPVCDSSNRATTDGRVLMVKAKPQEGALILGPPILSPKDAVVRCSIRTDGPEAKITIGVLDRGPDTYLTTRLPHNSIPFIDGFRLLSVFHASNSSKFQPLIQVFNVDESRSVTVYLDNLDTLLLDPGKCYSPAVLGDDWEQADLRVIPFRGEIYEDPITRPTPRRTPEVRSKGV